MAIWQNLSLNLTGDASGALTAIGAAGDGLKNFSSKAAGIASAGLKTMATTAAAGAVAIGGALTKGFVDYVDFSQSKVKLQAQLGLTAEQSAEYGEIAGNLYKNNFGESLEDINNTLAPILQNIQPFANLDNGELEKLTGQFTNFASVFETDANELSRAVSTMLKTGLVDNTTEAMDIITKGFQSGVNSSDDLLDTFNEYGVLFQKMGIDGETALGLLSQGLKGGARNADLAADAIKEFSIRATDGSTTSAAAYEALGINAAEMTAQIARGGDDAASGLTTVLNKLRGMEDPVARSAAAVGIFGTQAEDLGDALYALDPSTAVAGMGEVAGASDKMADALSKNPMAAIEGFKRSLQMNLIDFIGGKVIPVAKSLYDQWAPVLIDLFQNKIMPLVTNLYNEWAPKIKDLFNNVIIPTLTNFYNTALPIIVDFFQNQLIPFAKDLYDEWAPRITDLFQNKFMPFLRELGDWWSSHGPGIAEIAGNIFGNLAGAVENIAPHIQNIAEFVFNMGKALIENAGPAIETVMPILEDLSGVLEFVAGPAFVIFAGVVVAQTAIAVGAWMVMKVQAAIAFGAYIIQTGLATIATLRFVGFAVAYYAVLSTQAVVAALAASGAWVASAAVTSAIWLLYAVDAVKAAGRVVAAWVVSRAQTVAIWVLYAIDAAKQAARVVAAWAISSAQTIAIWAIMGAQAVTRAAVIAGAWIVSNATALASTLTTWAGIAAASIAGALATAAAWLIAAGPVILFIATIALVVAAVAGAVYLIVRNWDTIVSATRTAWDWVTNMIGNAAKWIWDVISNYSPVGLIVNNWNTIIDFFRNIPNNIKNALGNVGSMLYESGKDIIRGLINGIKDMGSAAWNAVKGVGSSIKSGFNGMFGINSPSRWAIERGVFIGQGLGIGLEKSETGVLGSLNNLSSSMKNVDLGVNTAAYANFRNSFDGPGGISANSAGNSTVAPVTINAEFPNVQNREEIEAAFESMMNKAFDGSLTRLRQVRGS